MEREAKWLEDQKRMTKAGLKYGIGIGAAIYVALFFCQRNFFGNDLLPEVRTRLRSVPAVGILALLGAAMGAAVGYAVGLPAAAKDGHKGRRACGNGSGAHQVDHCRELWAMDLADRGGCGSGRRRDCGYTDRQMVDMSIGWD